MKRLITVGDLNRTFIEIHNFINEWKKLGLTDDDLMEFEYMLMQDPKEYPVIKGTGGLRKVRFSPERINKGKSGAYRIIYLDLDQEHIVILLVAYSKNTLDNLGESQKKELKQLVDLLKSQYGGN